MSFIISRVPLRCSFAGGGADFKDFVENNESYVISCAINKYTYTMVRKLPKFHEHKSRIVYSQIETVKQNSEIQHKVIQKVFETLNIHDGIELFYSSDLPKNSGTGSSSSFIGGLLQSLTAINNEFTTQKRICEATNIIESDIINETIGLQDIWGCVTPGIKKIDFTRHGVIINPLILYKDFIKELEESCLMIYTGISRMSSDIAKECVSNLSINDKRIGIMQIAREVYKQFRDENIAGIGQLQDKSWDIKKSLASNVTNAVIDAIYSKALSLGCYGGRLMGSGAGGMFLIIFPKELRKKIMSEFKELTVIDFKIDFEGARIIYA